MCDVGMAVAALYQDHWYRATITSLHPGHVKVFYVDFGNSATVKSKDIRLLPREYMELPAQAISFSLYAVGPTAGSWNDKVFHTSPLGVVGVLHFLVNMLWRWLL